MLQCIACRRDGCGKAVHHSNVAERGCSFVGMQATRLHRRGGRVGGAEGGLVWRELGEGVQVAQTLELSQGLGGAWWSHHRLFWG